MSGGGGALFVSWITQTRLLTRPLTFFTRHNIFQFHFKLRKEITMALLWVKTVPEYKKPLLPAAWVRNTLEGPPSTGDTNPIPFFRSFPSQVSEDSTNVLHHLQLSYRWISQKPNSLPKLTSLTFKLWVEHFILSSEV